jgi:hypothetical protein
MTFGRPPFRDGRAPAYLSRAPVQLGRHLVLGGVALLLRPLTLEVLAVSVGLSEFGLHCLGVHIHGVAELAPGRACTSSAGDRVLEYVDLSESRRPRDCLERVLWCSSSDRVRGSSSAFFAQVVEFFGCHRGEGSHCFRSKFRMGVPLFRLPLEVYFRLK